MATDHFRALGSSIDIIVHPSDSHDDDEAQQAIEMSKARMAELEALLSRFRPDSEISQINRHPDRWVDVHPDTLHVLELAQKGYERTSGMFNPFLGQVLENAGYDVSFDRISVMPKRQQLTVEFPYVPPTHCPIELDQSGSRARVESGYKVDLGGIAKGWIVQESVSVIKQLGFSQILCNAGGDLVCVGNNGVLPWSVGVADPFVPNNILLNLDVTDLAVATSGTYRRKWSFKGSVQHHIIDPFLGRPAETDVVSCTVVHNDLVEGELLAKVALLLGAYRGKEWLKRQARAWVIVTHSGEVEHTWN